jgi:hypothetical protein
MTEVRCLFCLHWRPDDDNPAATEREFQMRFGPEVAVAGPCGHPDTSKALTNSLYSCERWEPKRAAHQGPAPPSREGDPSITDDC